MKEQGQPSVPTADERIVDMYWERNPEAIQETDKKYGKVLRNVAYNILFDDLDCEECQNDTYLGVWNAIPSTRPASFAAFIMRIMRWTAISRYKEKSRKKRIPSQMTISLDELADSISSGVQIEEEYESKQLGKLISDYVWSLNEKQRYLFVDRYYLAESVEKTASDLSVSTQSVYRELRKIKQGLKEYLERNGVHI